MADSSYRGDASVLFAAERNLLAWGRSGIGLMGFGFVVERFGLFLHLSVQVQEGSLHRSMSLVLGVGLIVMGALANLIGLQQFSQVSRTIEAGAAPPGYWRHAVMWFSAAQIVVAATLAVYFIAGA